MIKLNLFFQLLYGKSIIIKVYAVVYNVGSTFAYIEATEKNIRISVKYILMSIYLCIDIFEKPPPPMGHLARILTPRDAYIYMKATLSPKLVVVGEISTNFFTKITSQKKGQR